MMDHTGCVFAYSNFPSDMIIFNQKRECQGLIFDPPIYLNNEIWIEILQSSFDSNNINK